MKVNLGIITTNKDSDQVRVKSLFDLIAFHKEKRFCQLYLNYKLDKIFLWMIRNRRRKEKNNCAPSPQTYPHSQRISKGHFQKDNSNGKKKSKLKFQKPNSIWKNNN